ncbi:MAG: hypothetical protein V4490_08565 [Pseudomonadota bacterium]
MAQNNMTDDERYAKIKELLDKLEADLLLYKGLTVIEVEIRAGEIFGLPDDYSAECTMCGKLMQSRPCGMCVHCEQVWNG